DYELFCGLGDSVSPTELAGVLGAVTLVDIREPWEAELAAIPGARLVPVDDIQAADDLVVFCHHGVRSARAVQALSARGIRARQLAGGIDAWSRLVDPTIPRY
ncbi:MAG: molybdopterin biosynthesis protein MoeB, partial [Microbacteriaceae bacterium]|nr:molybdopterin biosynthesis protein MoeB [Microbacteriaceae bacterium]